MFAAVRGNCERDGDRDGSHPRASAKCERTGVGAGFQETGYDRGQPFPAPEAGEGSIQGCCHSLTR